MEFYDVFGLLNGTESFMIHLKSLLIFLRSLSSQYIKDDRVAFRAPLDFSDITINVNPSDNEMLYAIDNAIVTRIAWTIRPCHHVVNRELTI